MSTQTHQAPRFYTVAEAAHILRMHPRTIRRHILRRHLVAIRLRGGRAWLIAEAELKRAVNEGANNA